MATKFGPIGGRERWQQAVRFVSVSCGAVSLDQPASSQHLSQSARVDCDVDWRFGEGQTIRFGGSGVARARLARDATDA